MSDYTPEDIVKYSLSGDGARAKEAIQGVLANKVIDGLEAKKAEIGARYWKLEQALCCW